MSDDTEEVQVPEGEEEVTFLEALRRQEEEREEEDDDEAA